MLEGYIRFWANLLLYNDKDYNARTFALRLLLWPAAVVGVLAAFWDTTPLFVAWAMLAATVVAHVIAYTYNVLGANSRASKVEEVLPDFLSLVASNIRSGLTPDRALVVSAREEFGPLTQAVNSAAKNSITGMPLDQVMIGMSERIHSDVLEKTVRLIVEGLHSGGDMGELLEKTALDLRKFRSVRKEINSVVLNYVLFIMAAIALGAPLMYGVATFLVDIMIRIKSKVGKGGDATLGQVGVFKGSLLLTPEAITIFAAAAIAITAFFGCMAVGVMSTGKRMDGLKYFPLIMLIALGLLFGIKMGLGAVLGPLMG